MGKRSSHVSKSMGERKSYQKYIAEFNAQPTADDSIKFHESSVSDEKIAEPTMNKKRKIPINESLRIHITNNWIGYLIIIVTGLLLFFARDSIVRITSIENNISFQQKQLDNIADEIKNDSLKQDKQIDDIKFAINEIENQYFEQRLNNKELELRINQLEKNIEK